MFEFIINGKKQMAEKSKNLLDYLRDDLRLTGTKNGCSEGACGTCTVIIDGKSMKACVLTTERINGKSIITIEGLTERERDVYSYAFSKTGAVQCGFCIPGMVISSKVLLDKNLNPTLDEIKTALRGNICRCTGYIKIFDAVKLAAETFRENLEIPKVECKGLVGENLERVDAVEKTLGTGIYVDDVQVEGMLHGSCVRPEHPRVLVKKVNLEKAQAYPGVVAVLAPQNVPKLGNLGHLVKDWPAFIAEGEATRYIGDSLALVIAETEEALAEAKKLVEVEYEILEPVRNPIEAMKEDAPKIHEKGNLLFHQDLRRGNPDEKIKNSKYVVKDHFSVPFTDHAFMEPECAIGIPDGEDKLLLYTASQNIFDEQREIAQMLGIEADKIRIQSKLVGGGFGGKEDMSVQHHAALAAYMTKRPVKVKFTRQESIMYHTKRHPMEMDFTVGCDENGVLQGLIAEIISDTGAYASLGGPVLQRACTHAAGPYNFQDIDIKGSAYYTNNPPAGAYRGFGVTQSLFAMEACLNKLADMVGISHLEMRYRNAIKPGDILPNGQIADDSTAFVETLDAVRDEYNNAEFVGIGCGIKNSGLGVGIPDTGRCKASVENGKVHIRTAAACIGQGLATVMIQIAAETLEMPHEMFIMEQPDTARTPNSGTTTASRQTLVTGEAVRKVTQLVKDELDKGKTLADLEGEEFYAEYLAKTDPIGTDVPNPVSHVGYGYATQIVILDENGMLKRVVAAHDVGTPINPINVEGQIEGGVVMSLGYALTEDFPLVDSMPKVKYGTLGLFRATQTPEIKSIIVKKKTVNDMAYGAKGVGEIASIPTAPAVQDAYYMFDKKFRTKLPLRETPYNKKKIGE
ncbi:MAG: selenium-dependent xanthine dehydrogenase [Sebaldella sp.]|nr:selenium-dependent xanthine dehydrogenase [Sebaldella sp.]